RKVSTYGPILPCSCVPLTSAMSRDLSSAFSTRAQTNSAARATFLAYGPSVGVLPARTRASRATQVLPTSGGSLTWAPSTRPPLSSARQPPPWPQPPLASCCPARYSRPFLTASLRGLGGTAVPGGAAGRPLSAGPGGPDLGGAPAPAGPPRPPPSAAARAPARQVARVLVGPPSGGKESPPGAGGAAHAPAGGRGPAGRPGAGAGTAPAAPASIPRLPGSLPPPPRGVRNGPVTGARGAVQSPSAGARRAAHKVRRTAGRVRLRRAPGSGHGRCDATD